MDETGFVAEVFEGSDKIHQMKAFRYCEETSAFKMEAWLDTSDQTKRKELVDLIADNLFQQFTYNHQYKSKFSTVFYYNCHLSNINTATPKGVRR